MYIKQMILNAKNFGMSKFVNQAVLESCVNGYLTSASLVVNSEAYDNAINDILPDCPTLSVGIELNLTNGLSLSKSNLISDENNLLNNNFLYYFFNRNNKNLLIQIEKEFRLQIEKMLTHHKIEFIDSLDYIHSIPEIFEIVCKLANEYNIKYVKTYQEEFYIIKDFLKHLNIQFVKNLCNYFIQTSFIRKNKKTLYNYKLKTNDFYIGILYDKIMDSNTVLSGLETIEEYAAVEVSISPRKYDNQMKDSFTKEFSLTLNKTLEQKIKNSGFDIVGYKNILEE